MSLDRWRRLFIDEGQNDGRSRAQPPSPRDEKAARSATNADYDRPIDSFRARNSALGAPGSESESAELTVNAGLFCDSPITNHQSPITDHRSLTLTLPPPPTLRCGDYIPFPGASLL